MAASGVGGIHAIVNVFSRPPGNIRPSAASGSDTDAGCLRRWVSYFALTTSDSNGLQASLAMSA